MFAYRRVFLAVCVFCFGHAKALEPAELQATVSPSVVVVVGYNNSDLDESMQGSGVESAKAIVSWRAP